MPKKRFSLLLLLLIVTACFAKDGLPSIAINQDRYDCTNAHSYLELARSDHHRVDSLYQDVISGPHKFFNKVQSMVQLGCSTGDHGDIFLQSRKKGSKNFLIDPESLIEDMHNIQTKSEVEQFLHGKLHTAAQSLAQINSGEVSRDVACEHANKHMGDYKSFLETFSREKQKASQRIETLEKYLSGCTIALQARGNNDNSQTANRNKDILGTDGSVAGQLKDRLGEGDDEEEEEEEEEGEGENPSSFTTFVVETHVLTEVEISVAVDDLTSAKVLQAYYAQIVLLANLQIQINAAQALAGTLSGSSKEAQLSIVTALNDCFNAEFLKAVYIKIIFKICIQIDIWITTIITYRKGPQNLDTLQLRFPLEVQLGALSQKMRLETCNVNRNFFLRNLAIFSCFAVNHFGWRQFSSL